MMRQAAKNLILLTFFLIGLVQGIGFTTIPAAGNFITSASGFGFNAEQYGALFLPMIVGAVFTHDRGRYFRIVLWRLSL